MDTTCRYKGDWTTNRLDAFDVPEDTSRNKYYIVILFYTNNVPDFVQVELMIRKTVRHSYQLYENDIIIDAVINLIYT